MTKKLYKSRRDKMLCGVCGGIAEYFEVDPVLVRVIFVILTFAGGSAILAYIIGCIIIPHQPLDEQPAPVPAACSADSDRRNGTGGGKSSGGETAQAGALFIGVILIMLGAVLLMRNIPIFDHYWLWFRWHAWRFFWPAVIIAIGLALIFRGGRK